MVLRRFALAAALLLSLLGSNLYVFAQERTPEYSGVVYVIVESTVCWNPSPEGFVVWTEYTFGAELPVFAAQPWEGYIMVDAEPPYGTPCLIDPAAVSDQNPLVNEGDDTPSGEEPKDTPVSSEETAVELEGEEVVPAHNPEPIEPPYVEAAPVSTAPVYSEPIHVTGLPSTGAGAIRQGFFEALGLAGVLAGAATVVLGGCGLYARHLEYKDDNHRAAKH